MMFKNNVKSCYERPRFRPENNSRFFTWNKIGKTQTQRLRLLLLQSLCAVALAFGMAGVLTFPTSTAASATFTDDNWSAVGTGVNGSVRALAISGSDVYAGGDFTMAGAVGANHIARWNGTNWSALGSGVNGNVRAVAV